MSSGEIAIRDASTLIVLRDRSSNPKVLMGQRGAKAAFMPNKVVFPGGAVDPGDYDIPLAADLSPTCLSRIQEDLRPQTSAGIGSASVVAAIRELWEETGLVLGQPGTWQGDPPMDWQTYAATGHIPDPKSMEFVFRAITPPGRPRRFDARFFYLDAEHLSGDLDDFSAASDELSHLQWIPLADVRQFDLPFITEVVLAQVQANLAHNKRPATVPFFKNGDEDGYFKHLNGEG